MPKVKIFTTKTCPYCHVEKEYLKSQNVQFSEVKLDEQPEQIQAAVDKCGSMGVPCTHIVKDDGSEISILGFDKPKIDDALGLS